MLRLMIGTRTIATRLEFLGKQPGETVIVRIVRSVIGQGTITSLGQFFNKGFELLRKRKVVLL